MVSHPVLPEQISARIRELSWVVAIISSQDQNLQRTVEQIFLDSMDEAFSQIMEKS